LATQSKLTVTAPHGLVTVVEADASRIALFRFRNPDRAPESPEVSDAGEPPLRVQSKEHAQLPGLRYDLTHSGQTFTRLIAYIGPWSICHHDNGSIPLSCTPAHSIHMRRAHMRKADPVQPVGAHE